MLSGEGNENGENTIIGLLSKKSNFTRAAHFFCNVKLPGYTFYGRIKCCTCSFSFLFSLSLFSPWLPLAFLIFSPLLQNFMLFLRQKNASFVFSLSSGSFSPALSLLASRPTFSFSIFQICGHRD